MAPLNARRSSSSYSGDPRFGRCLWVFGVSEVVTQPRPSPRVKRPATFVLFWIFLKHVVGFWWGFGRQMTRPDGLKRSKKQSNLAQNASSTRIAGLRREAGKACLGINLRTLNVGREQSATILVEIRHSFNCFNKIAKSLLKCLEKIVHFFELFWLNCTFQPRTFQCLLLRYPRDQGSPIWAIPVLWMRPCSVYRLSLRCCQVGCSSQECAVVHAQLWLGRSSWVYPVNGPKGQAWQVAKQFRPAMISWCG